MKLMIIEARRVMFYANLMIFEQDPENNFSILKYLLSQLPSYLNSAYLTFYRLDCGTGPGAVTTSGKVRLNHWNRLTVFRHDWGVWLQLNGGRHDEGRSQVNIRL